VLQSPPPKSKRIASCHLVVFQSPKTKTKTKCRLPSCCAPVTTNKNQKTVPAQERKFLLWLLIVTNFN
jgi:hypothetical protein